MLQKIREVVARNLTNIPGWRTDRKIVVFESDDWGAARMSSKKNLSKLSDSGLKVENCHYVQNDALASESDLNRLFDLLTSFTNARGYLPVITANVVMANPEFAKIRSSDFREYHYELFSDSLRKYPEHQNSFKLWKEAMKAGIFHPQFHGREHLQVMRWMKFLQKFDSDTRKAFNHGVFGLSSTVTNEDRKSYMAAYDWDDEKSRTFVLDAVSEGLTLFKSTFGYSSLSTIAPNYVWHEDIEKLMGTHGVKYLQGARVQKSPVYGSDKFQYIRHFTGQENDYGQRYLVRNCTFEPSSDPGIDWVEKCLRDIETAFFWKKPAIVEMHRVNFIGYINPENRERNLLLFRDLLNKIIQKWPEVEFMTSDRLGQLMDNHE